MTGTTQGTDGKLRCPWALSAPEYVDYHDREWGRRFAGEGAALDQAMFERLSLEAFQSGLSWLIILRKREAFRAAFEQFDIDRVAGFGEAEVARLMADEGIVRNRMKVLATIDNARAALGLPKGLAAHIASFAPRGRRRAPRELADVPSQSDESVALAKDLRKRGFRFVGPTTLYALMQATGLVNDHLADCWCR